MAHLIVTVNKLNRRSSPIANVADKSNIIDTVRKGFSFDSVDETSNAAGTWYKDAAGNYYWAGGLMMDGILAETSNTATTAVLKAPATIPHDMPLSQSQCINCATWLKNNFEQKIIAAVENTAFDEQLVYAIACQETAQRWQLWMNVTDAATILERCVFDASGDFPDTSRSAFPKNKNEFEAAYGSALTQMLIDEGNKMRTMPQPGFANGFGAANYLYKGYGIFQYDLQNIKTDEIFFRNKLWYSMDECLARLLKELNEKWKAHPSDMYNTVKAYNGSGSRAEDYVQRVSQFYTWIKMI